MANGAISDAQINSSSQSGANHAATLGRLHSNSLPGAWSSRELNANQWIQIDLLSLRNRVTRVATQGRPSTSHNEWVTKYKLQYSNIGVDFQYYKERGKTTDKVKYTQSIPAD